jgi:hypothetical protein
LKEQGADPDLKIQTDGADGVAHLHSRLWDDNKS